MIDHEVAGKPAEPEAHAEESQQPPRRAETRSGRRADFIITLALSAAGDAHPDRGADVGGQLLERVEQPLQLGAQPVDLIDQVEQHRHVLLGEAELVLEIADQRRAREIGLGEGLRGLVGRLDPTLLAPTP